MKQTTFNVLVGFSLILGLALSCKDKPKNGRTDTYSSGTITFVSDESFSPIINEEVAVFENTYPNAKLKAIYTNELDAVNMLMKEKTYLAITSRKFTAKEKKNLEDRNFMPIAIPLAYDALTLIVNNANPDTIISVQDIKQILGGKVAQWKDIYPTSKLGDIEVAFDNKQSSTVHWLNDKRDTTNVTFKRNIKVMGVSKIHPATVESSWQPYQFYIYNGNYPLVRTIYALLNDPLHALPWGFANFIAADHRGQLIIHRAGLLPYRANMAVRDVVVSDR